MDPYLVLQDIERNSRCFSVHIPRQVVKQRDWLGIGFRVGDLHFVCALNDIVEILRMPKLTPLPSAHAWFCGTTNLRGKILPVTDLRAYIEKERSTGGASSRILVIQLENAHYGFVVEQISGIERFFSDEIKPAHSFAPAAGYLPYVEGIFVQDNNPWLILNFKAIINAPEFYHLLITKNEMSEGDRSTPYG